MITLKATSESLELVTSSTADIDISVSWVDITTTTFTPSSTETKVNSIATTPILAAPLGSTERQVKNITIRNIHATTSNTIYVQKKITATLYILTPAVVLLAGEVFEYTADGTWVYYASNGVVKATATAAGSDTQIQFNDGGLLGGDADFTWTKATNTLSLLGANTSEVLKNVTTEPAAPSTGNLTLYAFKMAGRPVYKSRGELGLPVSKQAAIWGNNSVYWDVGTGVAAGVYRGTVGANLGTAAAVLPTTTNLYTMLRRSTFATIITTQNQQVGIRTEAMFCRGNATGLGGFFFFCRFGFTSIKTGCRAFVGLTAGTTAVVTGDPSALTNIVGFAFDLADTAWTFMHNDGSGTATKDAIAGQGTLATNNTSFDAYIFCFPNDATVYYRLDQINSGAPVTLCDTSAATDLPVNTTLLTAQCVMSNGTANIVAGDATIGVNRLYIETEK